MRRSRMRFIAFLGGTTLCLAALLAAGCRDRSPEPPAAPRHVFLVTIDTLRADHLGAYGYPRPTSPFLDRLAAEGIQMDRAYSSMSTTVPSHASLFTGIHPLRHGVSKNGLALPEAVTTLAELLAADGFRTAGFASTGAHFGPGRLAQGFQTFDEADPEVSGYRPAAATVEKALAWLAAADPDDRLFLWLHLFDPHTPYEESNRMAASPGERDGLTRHLLDTLHVDFDHYGRDESRLLAVAERYDGEIRAADQAIERLFTAAGRLGFAGDDLWVVAADHGEGLGNHRWQGHGRNIYEEQIRVPLLFRFGSGWRAGARVAEVVELVDLLPTLVELLRLEHPEAAADGDGASMLPLLSGLASSASGESAFAQRRHYDPPREGAPVGPDANYEAGETFTLVGDRFKYIMRTAGDDELFDLVTDPGELRDLTGQGLKEERMQRAELVRRIRGMLASPLPHATPVDDETLQSLRALGYVQ